jgi:hypothetical protein
MKVFLKKWHSYNRKTNIMRLILIKYNEFQILRKVFIGLVITGLIVVYILKNKPINVVYIWVTLSLFFIIYLVLSLLKNYSTYGSIIIDENDTCVIQTNSKSEKIIINSLKVIYSGYKGEAYPFEYFITFTNARDGTYNYIIINDKSYQILIKSKQDLQKLLTILDIMQKKGIQTSWVKYHYLKRLKIKMKEPKNGPSSGRSLDPT